MIAFERGDVVLVTFVFVDERGKKKRPGLILSANEYNEARADAVMLAITSNVDRMLAGDALIVDWRGAGLPQPSLLTATVRTIKRSMVAVRLGAIAPAELRAAEQRVAKVLGLGPKGSSA